MARFKITDAQYNELNDIATLYGMTVGGYQDTNGVLLFTSESMIHGNSFQELASELHKIGQARVDRIKRNNK